MTSHDTGLTCPMCGKRARAIRQWNTADLTLKSDRADTIVVFQCECGTSFAHPLRKNVELVCRQKVCT
jgi:hypothetical protein